MSFASMGRQEFDLAHRSRQADRWNPTGTEIRYDQRRPEVGDVIAWERRAWVVMHVRVEEPRTDAQKHYLEQCGVPEYREQRLPYLITLRRRYGPVHPRENSAGDVPLRAPAGMRRGTFEFYQSNRVPLCSCCNHPWPCLSADADIAAEASMELMDLRMSRMGPGICYGCGEPITSRQSKFTMTGDHADFPGTPAPEFHARKKCDQQMLAYKKRAAAATPEPTDSEEQQR